MPLKGRMINGMKSQSSALILCSLLDGPKTTRQLADAVGLHFSCVHRHLELLRQKEIGLVSLAPRGIWAGLGKQQQRVFTVGPKVKEWAKKNVPSA